jgi:uncharacterized protein YutD
VEDRARYGIAYRDLDSLPKDNPWTNKEERRTVSGYVEKDTYALVDIYDPICDNCYSLYEDTTHKRQYIPRLGHIGYVLGEQEYSDVQLQQFYADSNKNFNLAWPMRYLLA